MTRESVKKPRLLDLFCGAGGCSMGYHRAGFEVVGVDIKPQKNYPFEFHQADALEFPLEGFDAIHASPPCQAYSWCAADSRDNHDYSILPASRCRLIDSGKPFVLENVVGAIHLMLSPIVLCGSMFGLPIYRHRAFEIRPIFSALVPPCNHSFNPILITGTTNRRINGKRVTDPRKPVRQRALGIDWMTVSEMDEAIPPAYTEFIGKQLMEYLK